MLSFVCSVVSDASSVMKKALMIIHCCHKNKEMAVAISLFQTVYSMIQESQHCLVECFFLFIHSVAPLGIHLQLCAGDGRGDLPGGIAA